MRLCHHVIINGFFWKSVLFVTTSSRHWGKGCRALEHPRRPVSDPLPNTPALSPNGASSLTQSEWLTSDLYAHRTWESPEPQTPMSNARQEWGRKDGTRKLVDGTDGDEGCEAGAAGALVESPEQFDAPPHTRAGTGCTAYTATVRTAPTITKHAATTNLQPTGAYLQGVHRNPQRLK